MSSNQEEDDAGRELEGGPRDAQGLEDPRADEREDQQHGRGHRARQPGGADPLLRRVVLGHGEKRRDLGQRIHDHEQRADGEQAEPE
jgi:hypothetical protein